MKAFFVKHKKLHIWLLADVFLLAAYFLCRENRNWMNFWTEEITTPLKRAIGQVCYLTEVSVMEVMCVLAVLACVAYVILAVRALMRAKGHRRSCAYGAAMGAVCIALSVYAGFCLMWGANFWADSFQEKSGIYAEPVAPEELLEVTIYFAQQLYQAADDVARDENGLFAVPREEILAKATHAYDAVEQQFPFMEFDDPGVKAMAFSRLMSRMDFTGFYCSWTGESNVNVDSPANMLASTISHELAHQRGIASEQECNFLAVLAATTCGDPVYAYSGWLMGYIHVSNALYRLSPDIYWAIRDQLPDSVKADLAYNTAYWDQFRDTAVQAVSTKVYDGLLKSYGDERGIQSYGTAVDMLVAYYKNQI